MKILVTGSAGFIGSDVVLRLLNRGDEVIGIDNHNDYYDPKIKSDRIERYINYSNSWILQRFKKDVINKWNSNVLIWDSEQTPLLRQFYKSIYKYISSIQNN